MKKSLFAATVFVSAVSFGQGLKCHDAHLISALDIQKIKSLTQDTLIYGPELQRLAKLMAVQGIRFERFQADFASVRAVLSNGPQALSGKRLNDVSFALLETVIIRSELKKDQISLDIAKATSTYRQLRDQVRIAFVGFRGDQLEIGLTPEQIISLVDYQMQMKVTDEQLISRFEEVAPRAPQVPWDPFEVSQQISKSIQNLVRP